MSDSLPTTPTEALGFLATRPPSTIRLGLDRVHAALKALRNPEANYPAIHVAGTNGKGSTCAFIASCLKTQGYRVGLYTSPHLQAVNERIKLGGHDIRDGALGECVLQVVNAAPELDLTYFELITVAALLHFSQERVDVAVLEVGLGGRLDATNASRPVVTAITPVSFDHMEYLGQTLPAIAAEKAGIIKPQVPVVVGQQQPDALEVIEEMARGKGAPVKLLGRDFDFEPDGKGRFTYRGMRTRVPGLWPGLRGPHQVQNAAMALACLELVEDRGLGISQPNAREGLASAEWPGRLEEFDGPPQVVLDGAHNPHGVEALVKSLEQLYAGRKVHLVFGVLQDKEHRPMLRALFPKMASVHLAPIDNPRGLPPEKYAAEARLLAPDLQTHASVEAALQAARAKATADGGLVVGAGSLMLIGQLRDLLAR